MDSSFAKKAVIDAFEKFGKTRRISEPNEAETRCELIDQILTAIGWESGGFCREVSTGTGDYVDYVLPRSTHPILVVEAKRSGTSFVLDETRTEDGRTRSLSTLLRNGGKSLKDALKQAAGYCNDKAIPFACVTNGYQWLFFRGLSSEARRWQDGRAIVFPSSDALITNFDDFLACIAPDRITLSELPRLLERPTPQEVPRPVIPLEHLTLRRKSVSDNSLDVRRIIGEQFFAQIHGGDRATMLAKCYVEPGEQPNFNRSLQRLLDDTLSSETLGEKDPIEGNTKDFTDKLQSLDISGTINYPILVVGNVGVGKTTFLYRTLASLREVSNTDEKDEKNSNYKAKDDAAMFSYIDLENQGNLESFDDQEIQRQTASFILEKLAQSAISTLKKRDDISDNARKEADPDDETTLRTMLRVRLDREYNSAKSYFEQNPERWADKEYELIQGYRKDSVTFLIHYIRHLRARFKRRDKLKYPILLYHFNMKVHIM
jgi:GTPase SAR1 family protein